MFNGTVYVICASEFLDQVRNAYLPVGRLRNQCSCMLWFLSAPVVSIISVVGAVRVN